MERLKMIAIVGATGKVGFATATTLRKAGRPVKAIVRDANKAKKLTDIGCDIAVADIQDPKSLAKAIGNAEAVQVILPPAPQLEDTEKQMREAMESIGMALEDVQPKRILAISDYGAHISRDIGMPTLCGDFERRLGKLAGHKIFLRSAEHMQGWGRAIPAAIASGTLAGFHDPVDIAFPTVSAPDVGLIAADLLLRPDNGNDTKIVHAEGPHRYSAKDVAHALSELLGRTIDVQAVPRSHWKEAFEGVMSESFAELLIKANDAQNEGGVVDVEPEGEVRYGTIDLIDALRPLLPSQ